MVEAAGYDAQREEGGRGECGKDVDQDLSHQPLALLSSCLQTSLGKASRVSSPPSMVSDAARVKGAKRFRQ